MGGRGGGNNDRTTDGIVYLAATCDYGHPSRNETMCYHLVFLSQSQSPSSGRKKRLRTLAPSVRSSLGLRWAEGPCPARGPQLRPHPPTSARHTSGRLSHGGNAKTGGRWQNNNGKKYGQTDGTSGNQRWGAATRSYLRGAPGGGGVLCRGGRSGLIAGPWG